MVRHAFHVILLIFVGFASGEMSEYWVRQRCERVREPTCFRLYNMTAMPTLDGVTQDEAIKRKNGYNNLVASGCSDFLETLLCFVYFPMCPKNTNQGSEKNIKLRPCIELCQHVKQRCEPILAVFGYPWPRDLRCEGLPKYGDLCLAPHKTTKEMEQKDNSRLNQKQINSLQMKNPNMRNAIFGASPNGATGVTHKGKASPSRPIHNITCSPAEVKIAYEHNQTCLTRCKANVLFSSADKRLAEVWTTVWAVLCLLSSILTVLTYAADASRFHYPERPIVYLCICYLFYSLTFIVRVAVGADRISCRELDRSTDKFLIRGGHEGTWCTLNFLINYFFLMASCLWWVILTLAWFLSAAKKWGHEGVEAVSSIFHMIAWAVPAVGTIVILIMHRIDGDELTGMCFVGAQNRDSLLIFMIVPMCVFLLVGITFLIFGFVSLIGVRKDLKMKDKSAQDTTTANIRRLEKLMVRIGIFSVLYVLPLVCVIGSLFYEFFNLPVWHASIRALTPRCLDKSGLRWNSQKCKRVLLPAVEVYMLKLFMSLVVGITSGTWVWANKKSLASWGQCVQTLVFRRRAKTPSMPPAVPVGIHKQTSHHGAFQGGTQHTPLMMHSGAMFAKQPMSRSVTSKLSDRYVAGASNTTVNGGNNPRVSSSCV